jgi:hypothetical protein
MPEGLFSAFKEPEKTLGKPGLPKPEDGVFAAFNARNTNDFDSPTYGEDNMLPKLASLAFHRDVPEEQRRNRACAIDLYRGFEDAVWDTVAEDDPNFEDILNSARKQDLASQRSINRIGHVAASKAFEYSLLRDIKQGKIKGKAK